MSYDHKIGLLCKSYRNDIDRVRNLLTSYGLFNRDGLPLFISVPTSDISLFRELLHTLGTDKKKEIALMADEQVTTSLIAEKINSFPTGYINQQIVKLSFWDLSLCENYVCLDSEGYFIRDFHATDFMFSQDTPFTVLTQDKDLAIQPKYCDYFESRKNRLRFIQNSIEFIDNRFMTCHAYAIFSSVVLQHFRDHFLRPRQLDYADILKEAPFEFSWYNQWLLKTRLISIVPIEPFIKIFHYRQQYSESLRSGIREKDIAKAYLGISMNSNWARSCKVLRYSDYLSYRDFERPMLSKMADKARLFRSRLRRAANDPPI